MDKNKKRAIRILAVFLAVMALCTVISRAAASMLVAQVQVEKIKKGRLTYTWEGKGQNVWYSSGRNISKKPLTSNRPK